MKITATVSSRSSRGKGGRPGEAEVLRLNPQRRETLLGHTGWDDLYEGTLNLEVHESVVENLGQLTPAIHEPGETVKYPPRYENVPNRRIAHLYFDGVLRHKGKEEQVLIRRAENPLKRRIEAFAPVRLRNALGLEDGDEVTCEIKECLVEPEEEQGR